MSNHKDELTFVQNLLIYGVMVVLIILFVVYGSGAGGGTKDEFQHSPDGSGGSYVE